MLDKYLEENVCNEPVILPKILESFKRHFPDLAALKIAKWKDSVEEISTSQEKSSNEQDVSVKTEKSVQKTPMKEKNAVEQVSQSTTKESENSQPNVYLNDTPEPVNENQILEEKGIYGFNLS